MLLTLVLICVTYIQGIRSMPPLPTNVYRNNIGNNFDKNKFNERFLQNNAAYLVRNENAYIKDSQRGNPVTVKNIPDTYTAQMKILNNKPQVKGQKIKVSPNVYDNDMIENVQQKQLQIQQNRNLLQQYNLPHNFKINLLGYVASEINNGLMPPEAILPKPFVATHVTPVQKIIEPSNLMIAETRNFEMINNQPFRNQPNIPLPEVKRENIRLPYVKDLSPQPTKKIYTIIHDNGAIEESNDFEYVKKNFPEYVVRDLSEQNFKRDNHPINTEVHVGSPIPNLTIVPIFNVAEPLPVQYQKETIVPNTLVGTPQSGPDLPKVTEKIETNSSNIHNITLSSQPSNNATVLSKNLTSPNTLSYPASSLLHTSILENIQTPFNPTPEDPPLEDNTIIQPSEIVTENSSFVLNDEEPDNKNFTHETINADDFWSLIQDIIEISNSSVPSNVTKKEENLPESTNVDEKNVTNKVSNSEIYTEIESVPIDDDEPKNKTNTGEKFEIFNVSSEIIDDFLVSIDERIDFIEPFLILNDTEEVETNNTGSLSDKLNTTTNLETKFAMNSMVQNNHDIIEKIDVPHISLLPDDDTNSTLWFMTNDEKAWDKLAPENKKSIAIAAPTHTIEYDKTITIYPNGTEVEDFTKTITEEKQPPLIIKTTKVTHLNGDVEIKRS